jgi:hypothetical protein
MKNLSKVCTLMVLLFWGQYISFAQKINFKISDENNNDYSLSLIASHDEFGTITFLTSFYAIINSEAARIHKCSIKKEGELARLYPINRLIDIRYKTSLVYSYRGKLDAQTDTNFVYRLPFSLSKKAQVNNVKVIRQDPIQTRQNKSGVYFELNMSDTIYVIRKGIVSKIVDMYDFGESDDEKQNAIFIEHDDGTVAKYWPILRNSMMVKAGQTVFPGTPLAFPGKSSPDNAGIRLIIFNPISNPKQTKNIEQMVIYKYYSPFFSTTEGTLQLKPGEKYQPACSTEMITLEMTPKQKVLYSKHKLK